MRSKVIAVLAVTCALVGNVAAADGIVGGKRPLLADGIVGGKRPLLADGIVGGKRPLITLA